ncbi:hypothetical protein DL96DRAFT_1470881 [Flagelloscypha sp. PMI_526]|nr:hypothetical protein DL96DRAFT_1470881 [Flagelloscypha sp. PMI_526]
MPSRTKSVTYSISRAILRAKLEPESHTVWNYLNSFFCIWALELYPYQQNLFRKLRLDSWEVKDDAYKDSFKDKDSLQAVGDMGYSGSTFFITKNGNYIVKSVPREFEHTFFRDDLLEPYISYMATHPKSLLVRIVDFLACPYPCIGSILSLAPTHHIVMENLLVGEQEAEQAGGKEWRTWDLKPHSYFYPERDIAGGLLATEATKSKLADKFDDEIPLKRVEATAFWGQLEEDTLLLQHHNAVDYSLFLVRIPLSETGEAIDPFSDPTEQWEEADLPPTRPPFTPPQPPSWRTGFPTADHKYVFRATVLDFFWAKHTLHAKTLTGLVRFWNVFASKGHMSITTTPEEYRQRFLKMCREIIRVVD